MFIVSWKRFNIFKIHSAWLHLCSSSLFIISVQMHRSFHNTLFQFDSFRVKCCSPQAVADRNRKRVSVTVRVWIVQHESSERKETRKGEGEREGRGGEREWKVSFEPAAGAARFGVCERSERYFRGFKWIVWFLHRKAQTLAAPLQSVSQILNKTDLFHSVLNQSNRGVRPWLLRTGIWAGNEPDFEPEFVPVCQFFVRWRLTKKNGVRTESDE